MNTNKDTNARESEKAGIRRRNAGAQKRREERIRNLSGDISPKLKFHGEDQLRCTAAKTLTRRIDSD